MKEENRIAERAAEAKTKILSKRTEAATIASERAVNYLKQLPDAFDEDSPVKNVIAISDALEATKRTLEVLGLSCLDSDDLIRELAKRLANKASRRRKPLSYQPDPEDLLGLSDEPDAVQPGHSAASGLLEPSSRDMPSSSESGDQNGSGAVG